jgi:hypothetical protein
MRKYDAADELLTAAKKNLAKISAEAYKERRHMANDLMSLARRIADRNSGSNRTGAIKVICEQSRLERELRDYVTGLDAHEAGSVLAFAINGFEEPSPRCRTCL